MDVVSYVIGYQSGLKKGSEQGVKLPELENPAGAAQIREGYEAIDANGGKIKGGMPEAVITVGTPSIDSNGVLTAGVSYSEGYVPGGGKAATFPLPALGTTTINPGLEDQIIKGNKWLTGDITVQGVTLQEKTVTPGPSAMEVTPDEGYLGLGKVTVAAAGGGSMEGVHVVTFMSQDGLTELYKRPVADGDDCADPVTRGYIPAPTKASTVQYDYSFVGWATTPNGAWDTNALKTVTEDKTVYAAFASVVRYYTITYYDDDGTTVLKTESLAYGATPSPSYKPIKDGVAFDGWIPELVAVTGDASYTAKWTSNLASGVFTTGAEWTLAATGELTISGEGATDNYYQNGTTAARPWQTYRDRVTTVVIEGGITSIGDGIFDGHTNLTSVYIHNGVAVIGERAFRACSALMSINLPDSVTTIKSAAFQGCGFKTINLPAGLVTLRAYAFYTCKSLLNITIPNSVKSLSGSTFYGCTSLQSVTLGTGLTSLGKNEFSGCTALTAAYFLATTTWYVSDTAGATTTKVTVTNAPTAATYLKSTYVAKYWTKK